MVTYEDSETLNGKMLEVPALKFEIRERHGDEEKRRRRGGDERRHQAKPQRRTRGSRTRAGTPPKS